VSNDAPPVRATYGQVDTAYGMRLATTPPGDDGPIWMVNLMRYHQEAQYADGSSRGLTGKEADDRYAPLDVLHAIGADVVIHGDVEGQFLSDHPRWDRVGVVRYPSRRAFIDMQSREDFRERHVHKAAGMAETIVMGCVPAAVPEGADDPALLTPWDAVPHPPTPDDGPVAVVHVIRFHEGPARASMDRYQDEAFKVAGPNGVRVGAWFDVEGTILGDGRQWHQVRFNLFPSKAAFMAVALDPARLEAHREHRDTAIAETYALIVRPGINTLVDHPVRR
jgi:hypothetical protein